MKPSLCIVALVCSSWRCSGGEGPIQEFKPGDYVEIVEGTTPQSCTVAGKYRADTRDYLVSCGAQDRYAPAGDTTIRARKPTAQEIKIALETASALARLPRPGNGAGAKYGTREPKTCATRREPAAGAPGLEQVKRTFLCDTEGEGATSLVLVAHLKVEIAPGRVFNSATDSRHPGIDPKQTVYDIRGSFTHYDCRQPETGDNVFARTHNCSAFDEPAAQGLCFRNTFGDWHCKMHDLHADILRPREHLLPPE